ncbi:MAG: DUF58 domain-containing protein [Candidatus Cloacimonetes bacterium]|nr:DUF58 domain-containing protein [Candidatus Cloacimonadota bacterium]
METSEILKRIRKIEITTKNLVEEIFAGEYHSLFRGQGLEFSEVREYMPGDGFRDIDWNVTARMGVPYVKKFEETRELNVIFLVDSSASTVFGTRNYLKSEYIAEITAVLSFSALSNQDKVGLLLFSDRIEKYIPPRKGRKIALQILREILFFNPEGRKTDIKQAVEYISRVIKKRSIIFVISDFQDDGFWNSLKLLARRHDVLALQIIDRAESELPDAGIIPFIDPESGELFTTNTSNKKVRDKFKLHTAMLNENTRRSFKENRVDMLELHTDQSYVLELQKFFKQRIRQKAKR